jgi:phosphoserine phosphatase
VARVTREGGSDFVPPPERIAVFDNDGTLWSEKPLPFQLLFALDRVKALAPQHPEWKTREPFARCSKATWPGDAPAAKRASLSIIATTHTGMTTENFPHRSVTGLRRRKHPATGRLFTGMVYQPMLELLAYLRANGFKTFIVSGGGVEFMRPWAEQRYGIPPSK